MAGLETFKASGGDISTVHSVASFSSAASTPRSTVKSMRG